MTKINLINSLKKCINTDIYTKQIPKPHSKHANWVIPGYVMCGPYPYTDGVNFKTRKDGDDNIARLKANDVSVFICLQDEIKDRRCIHPYFPVFMFYPDYHKGIEYYHYPIVDGKSTSVKYLQTIIKTILKAIYEKKKIYVHCAGGHGRTGMIVACLMKTLFHEIGMTDIIKNVQAFHDSRSKHDERTSPYGYRVRSPNTDEQINLCYEYEKTLSALYKDFEL